LQLKLLQWQAASKLGVSTVTMSRWERDAVYPTWRFQPRISAYLGYDPFTDPGLGSPKGNETKFVAILSPESPNSLGQRIIAECIKARQTRPRNFG
jgi:DNA-binding XRE family transcriptional regulator